MVATPDPAEPDNLSLSLSVVVCSAYVFCSSFSFCLGYSLLESRYPLHMSRA